jgi:predicted nucleic acid-binding Zn ribbon protein
MLNEVALALGVFVAGAVAAVLAWPWLVPAGNRQHGWPGKPALAAQREAILTALRDLDFDHVLLKITDADYASQRQVLVAEAAAVLAREEERATIARDCPVCGRPVYVGDLFCSGCGLNLSRPLAGCPTCGWPVEPEDVYCRGCGSRLQAIAPRLPPVRRLEAQA